MHHLEYLPEKEFLRVLRAECDLTDRARAFAALCRANALYMIRKAGSGHIGSSFSSLDIVSLVLLREVYPVGPGSPRGVYFSSKGHDAPGLYAALCGLGVLPFDKLHQLRRLGGLPGHPDVSTPGIAANTGSLGMGVSKAKGMIEAARLRGEERRVFVLTGDGELQEGQIWESLTPAMNRGLHELTVIVDHNKIQSDIWVSQTSGLGDLAAKFRAFGWHVQRVDGHDMGALDEALRNAENERALPSVIIADTLKGRGVSFMERRGPETGRQLYPYHSGAPGMETCRRAMDELLAEAEAAFSVIGLPALYREQGEITLPEPPESPQRLPDAYSRALVRLAGEREDLVVLDADLKLDCGLIPFEEKYPEQFIECGIAEQDMVSMAGGLALQGMLPVVNSFACFLTTRANEHFYTNTTEKTKIIYAGFLAGLLPAGPGHSHQCVRDISILAAMPGLTLAEPCCELEAEKLLEWCVRENPGSSYLRFVSIPVSISFRLPEDYNVSPGRGTVIREGSDAAIIASGPILLEQAFQAAELLARKGLSIKVVNLPWLNTVDDDWLLESMTGMRGILTLDNHFIRGGQGEMIAARPVIRHIPLKTHGLKEIPACGENHLVLERHQLDAASIARHVREMTV